MDYRRLEEHNAKCRELVKRHKEYLSAGKDADVDVYVDVCHW